MRVHAKVLLVLAAALVPGLYPHPAVTQQKRSALDCSTLVFSNKENCIVTLQPDQKQVRIVFRLNEQVPSSAWLPLTVVANQCCTDTTTYVPDANGFYAVEWSAESAPSASVLLSVYTGRPELDSANTIRLVPKKKDDPPVLGLVQREREHTYIWTRADWVPIPIHVEVDSFGGQKVKQESCEKIRFHFQPRLKGEVTPDTGLAVWTQTHHPSARRTGGDGAFEGTCVAETRWKLADAAGEQQLVLILGDGKRAQQERLQIAGLSREPPRLSAGFGVFTKVRRERDVACADEPALPDCEGAEEDQEITVVETVRGGGEPYFSLEFPVFRGYQVTPGPTRWVSEHVRLLVGSTFERPKDNYFVGIVVLPMLSSAAERLQFQFTGGYVPRQGGWYGGISLDTSTLVKPILSVLGFTL